MAIRERIELDEAVRLSHFATLSKNTKGRTIYDEPCEIRTEFMRDRDRIIHCNSFRRLKHKTQVFLAPQGDHYRERLTHTLEVSQISRTIARALCLNEDLCEAIALGHDLGHTPFGHAGERALNKLCDNGFVHSIQSVRVVDYIERDGLGLNLTYEVKNGIACHSDCCVMPTTLEGKVVRLSDKVAYINHDIEDAIRANILTQNDLPYNCSYILGRTKSQRISTIINSVIENSTDDIKMSDEVTMAHLSLKAFLFDNVYTNKTAKGQESKIDGLIAAIYEYYIKNSHLLPTPYSRYAKDGKVNRAVTDYIAGMTDQYAISVYNNIFVPTFWTKGF